MKIIDDRKYLEVGDVVYQFGTPYVRYIITRTTKTLAIAKVKRSDNTEIEKKFKIEIRGNDYVDTPNKNIWSTIWYYYESPEQKIINDVTITQHNLIMKVNKKWDTINLAKQDIPYLEKLLEFLNESKVSIKE